MRAITLAAAAAATLFAAGAANAQFYVGAAGGAGKSDFHCGSATGPASSTTSCDRSSPSGKVWAGYQFHPNWAGEISYVRPGETTTSFTDATGTTNRTIRPSYVGVGVANTAQFGNGPFGYVGRVGVAIGSGKVTDSTTAGSTSDDRSGTLHHYEGVGLTFAATQKVKLELDYEHSRSAVHLDGYKSTSGVNTLMAGASLAF